MIGVILLIFIVIPESPWWLASKGKVDRASKVLHRCYGSVEGYDVAQQIVSSRRTWIPGSYARQLS
jgi:MFS transporter, SP family, general alpha glucoside:H+ symporter